MRRRVSGAVSSSSPGSTRTASCPLTQEDIAAMAGTSRATVNRVLREEEKLGSVALARGRTTVLDGEALERRCRRGS